MKFDLSKYSNVYSVYSIVNPIETTGIQKQDTITPFSFTEFLDYFNFKGVSKVDYIEEYNQYLKNWFNVKGENNSLSLAELIRINYVSLLKEIEFNYLSHDEKIYLQYLNYDDPLELETAIPYFVDKLKEIIIYYNNKREYSKRSIYKWINKGSNIFIKNFIKDYILLNYSQNNNIRYQLDYPLLKDLNSDIKIEIEELYDYNNYYIDNNIYDLNVNTFLQSIENLALSATEDYSGDIEKSNIILEQNIVKKFLASDQYLISAYNNLSAVDINSFIQDLESVYSPHHIYTPTIAISSNGYNLKTSNYVGNLLSPKNQITSNYISSNFYYIPNWDKLNIETTNVITPVLSSYSILLTEIISLSGAPEYSLNPILIPDINYFSNEYLISIEYLDKLKNSDIDGGLANKPLTDFNLKRFYPYQSFQEKTSKYNSGISSPSDSLDFWNENTWKNSDVYPEIVNNILNKNIRERDLLFLKDKTLTKWASDIFGNSYGVYKDRFVNVPKEWEIGVDTILPLSTFGAEYQTTIISLTRTNLDLSAYDANEDGVLSLGEIPLSAHEDIKIYTNADNTFAEIDDIYTINNFYPDFSTSAFNIGLNNYVSKNSPLLQTSFKYIGENYKINLSHYEKLNSSGSLYISNNYKTFTLPITALNTYNIDTDKLENLNSKVIDIDILYNFYAIKCNDYYFYGEINYNYSSGELSFNNLQNFYIPITNDPLNKTSSAIINSNTNELYISSIFTNQYNLSSLDSSLSQLLGYSGAIYSDKLAFIPVIYTLDTKEIQYYISYNGYNTLSTFSDYLDYILPKEISTPQLSYNNHNKTMSLTIFVKDIFENIITFIHKFDTQQKDFKLLSSQVIYPEKFYIDNSINSHPLSGGPILSAYFEEINAALYNSFEPYYDGDNNYLQLEEESYKNLNIYTTYNLNDGIQYLERPTLKYNLNSIYEHLQNPSNYILTTNIWGLSATDVLGLSGFTDVLGLTTLEPRNLLGPCDITFDFRFLDSLYAENIVSSIYKIEMIFNDETIILDSNFENALESPEDFRSYSPISRNLTKRFQSNNTNQTTKYVVTIKCYCFESPYLLTLNLEFYIRPANIQQYFSNIELVDTYAYSLSGLDYLDLYLETKNPQYIIKNTVKI